MDELYQKILNTASSEKQDLLFTVSLIDDDPLFLEQMKDYLHSMKISKIDTYSSGEDFLAVMKGDDKRLVVCDFDFGSTKIMNGLQVLEAIKKINSKIPVIILSSQDKITVALESLRSGAVDYFIKGTENTYTSLLTTIMKINELQRLRKNERDYIAALSIGSAVALLIIGMLMFKLYG